MFRLYEKTKKIIRKAVTMIVDFCQEKRKKKRLVPQSKQATYNEKQSSDHKKGCHSQYECHYASFLLKIFSSCSKMLARYYLPL